VDDRRRAARGDAGQAGGRPLIPVPGAPILELNAATVVKDDRPVLKDLTLAIREGEHTAILGPNGAGKSLLVGLLTNAERPLAREDGPPPVRVFGKDDWDVFDLRHLLGIVSTHLHVRFVAGNTEGRIRADAAVLSAFLASYGILRYGTVTAGMRAKTAAALEAVGAAHLASRWLDELSSGEARRVMLARVLVTDPRALVLDEPTSGLDLAARHAFMERVRAIARGGLPAGAWATAATTIILVTHHLEEIIPEIGRVVLLRAGRIAGDGPTAGMLTAERLSDLFETPVAVERADGYHYARPRS
jgi:iron complex transport system ATP-binding protein